jgi:hypothetical protein
MADLHKAWLDARVKDLEGWKLDELVKRRDALGIKVDPRQSYSLAQLVAEEEMRHMELDPPIPGAILEAIEADPVGEFEMRYKDWDIANPEDIKMTVNEETNPYGFTTSSGWFIYEVLLPEFLRYFAKKNADYGDQHRSPDGLGVKGEFPGLRRRVHKLRRAIWDGEEMNHEGPEEMIHDLIGTCFIILDLMNQEKQQAGPPWPDTHGDDMPDATAY